MFQRLKFRNQSSTENSFALLKHEIQIFRERAWIAVESTLNVEVLAQAFRLAVSVAFTDHPVSVFVFELPDVLLEDVIDLFFDVQPVPQVEVVDFFVVARDVFIEPNLVEDVRLHAHPPDMLTMLHE